MRNINNYVRSYAKGKSFEFTEWSKLNNYTNSGIKQDFVTYGGSLYACICDVAAGNEPPDKDTKHWKLAVIGSYTKREDIIKLLGFEPVNLEGSNDFSKEQTFSGGISLNNTNIKEVADPEDDSDAATKNYVDQQITFRKGTGEGSARLDSSTASGDYSVAEGIQTITYNPGEHAEGVLNVSKRKEDVDDESYTIHSVGIGNDQEGSLDRKNAWEILKTGEAYLYGIGGYDGKNSEAHGSENAPKTVQKELLKIADPFSGVFCMKLGKSGSLTTEEVAAIREKLAYMLDNEKFYLVSIYDDVDKQFRGDCEIIRESSKNSYLIMQITAATTPTFIMTTYTFYADNTYTRDQYTSSLKSYSAGDGIAIDKDRKISCTIDTTLFRVVSSLPGTPAKGDENKLHIVKESTIEDGLFSGYLWVNEKWERLESPKSATALQPIQSITYEELVALRDSFSLVAGMQYRITDYTCTTTTAGTKSAGHVFDIIVTADSESVLNEEARAIQHDGDEYFANSDLNAWKIWYCLDNDTERFTWASDVKVDEIEHKSYDSSKCTIKSELIDGNAFITPFNFESCVWVDANNDGEEYGVNHDIDELVYEWGYFTDENNNTHLCIYKSNAGLYDEEGQPDYGDKYLYRGVVNADGREYDYWQKWDASNGGGVDIHGSGDYVYATTKRIVSNPEAYSATIETENIYKPGKGVIYRMIDEWNNDVPYDFKNIQFKCPVDPSKHPYYYYTFASGDKEANTDYSLNVANKCYSNTIKERITNSKRELNCIIFFGSSCYFNTFGINCYSNVFFGSSCHSNTFGINCYSNFFHDYCYRNTFGNYCYGNNFGKYCAHNTLGNSCSNIKFVKRTDVSTIQLNNYYRFNKIDDGVQRVYLSNTIMSGTNQNKQVQNYHIVRGVSGTESSYVTITTSLNLAYETRVAMNSSGEIKKYCEADLIS